MGAAFTWMLPALIFNYWVNNCLMGNRRRSTSSPGTPTARTCPARCTASSWIFEHHLLARPGGMTVLGTPLQLDQIMPPTFVTGAVADHLTLWKGCYRTTQLLGGDSTFVLSHSGHIASLVNPRQRQGAPLDRCVSRSRSRGLARHRRVASATKPAGSARRKNGKVSAV
jgi:polyhydroxyalkanoate synthase